jgi:hypothetical protein
MRRGGRQIRGIALLVILLATPASLIAGRPDPSAKSGGAWDWMARIFGAPTKAMPKKPASVPTSEKPASVPTPEKPKPPPAPPEPKPMPEGGPKRTVALLCYGLDYTTTERCKNMEKLLKAESCAGVDFVEMPPNPTLAETKAALEQKKLPKGTVLIVAGHTGGIDQKRTETVDPKTKRKTLTFEPFAEWQARIKKGDDNFLPRGKDDNLHGKTLRDTLESALEEPALWFSTCGAGGLCHPKACIGGSCSATELTSLPRAGGWIDPPTRQLITLLCDPKLRWAADKNYDGTLEANELKEVFRCDAKKYPATYTQHIYPTDDFWISLDSHDPPLSKEERKEKLKEHMKERDEWAVESATQYLAEFIVQSPNHMPDPFNQGRALKLQPAYRDTLKRQKIYRGESLYLKEFRAFVKPTVDVKSLDYHIVSVALPEQESTPDCYWGGLDTYFPEVESFRIPSH